MANKSAYVPFSRAINRFADFFINCLLHDGEDIGVVKRISGYSTCFLDIRPDGKYDIAVSCTIRKPDGSTGEVREYTYRVPNTLSACWERRCETMAKLQERLRREYPRPEDTISS